MVLVVKNLPANARGTRDVCSIPRLGNPLEKEMAPTPVFLPGIIPWTEETGRLQSDMTERLRDRELTFITLWEENRDMCVSIIDTYYCSITKSCLCFYPMDCKRPSLPVPHYLLEYAQVHIHWISDAIQPSHPLLPTSPVAFNFSQHQGLFH